MKTYVQKWGNSLALRIPKTYADEIQITANSPVELTLADGKLVIAPEPTPTYTLEELLAGVTDENLHGEIDTGGAAGNEVW
ncbi:MAG TPA: AbrB/MazE/SpoVT family DNA-binding domain-containing protein [Anaerolineae bacterium]|nr:AbrB/MazE/SpoVT family DNA-binding domain-containing protein [Anaerolineae bacterium]